MAHPPKPDHTSENKDESPAPNAADQSRDSDESPSDQPVIIEADAVEIDESDPDTGDISGSDGENENFPPAEHRTRSGILPFLIAGIIVGAIGVFAGYSANMNWYQADTDQAGFSTKIESNRNELNRLSTQLTSLEQKTPTPVDLAPLETRLETASAALDKLVKELGDLRQTTDEAVARMQSNLDAQAERITTQELQSGDASSAGAAAAKEQLESFRSDLNRLVSEAEAKVAAAEAEAQRIEQEAADAALDAQKNAALAKLNAAVESGMPFATHLEDMDNVPSELAEFADSGIPALVVLQQEFPDAARAALASAQQIPENASTGQRLSAFLKRQTNARSLAPRDGDDADAILSRAEANLARGDLTAALSEISHLPEPATAAMTDWIAQAHNRSAALDAVASLSDAMN